MRNLVFLNRGIIAPSSTLAPDLPLAASVFDTITNCLTVALGPGEFDGSIEVQQYEKSGHVQVLSTFNVDPSDEIVSFAHFSDICQLIFILAKGDIITATYDPSNPDDLDSVVIEIVGSISDGILSAQWSPDDEVLCLISGARNMILLSRQFEPIAERPLTVEDANRSKHVSVGWGKRETQFKGRGAKAAERAMLESLQNSGLKEGEEIRDPTMPAKIDEGVKSEFDFGKIAISWRGDCQYFAVSVVEKIQEVERRLIRVFDREGNLDSVSEPVNGLEDHLAWKPQGSLIASTQRKHPNDKHDHTVKDILINPELVDKKDVEEDLDLIFFERNGLRHGEFSLRLPLHTKIKDLAWNNSSEVLAVVLDKSVQLWTMKNYYWYLKQEIFSVAKNDIKYLKWHAEKPLTFMLATDSSVEIIDLAYSVISGPTVSPSDISMTGVIDGNTCNITPISLANVPPPMAFREINVDENVLDFSVSKSNERFAIITASGIKFARFSVKKKNIPSVLSSLSKNDLFEHQNFNLRQVAFAENHMVGVLIDDLSAKNTKIIIINLKDIKAPVVHTVIQPPVKAILLKSHSTYKSITFETANAKVYNINPKDFSMVQICQLGQLCYDYHVIDKTESADYVDTHYITESNMIVFGLASNGKLFVNDRHLTSAVTSIKVTQSHLLFTTAQHQLRFVHLNNDFSTYKITDDELHTTNKEVIVNHNNNNNDVVSFEDERIRAIERGSILISVSPSNFSVVLQAPRGNLETIYPRIMVLTEIRKNIRLKKYKEAFLICRTHRIDLDILHDYDPELFFKNLEHFINVIDSEDHLNLFVGCLHNDNVAETKYRETVNLYQETLKIAQENGQPTEQKNGAAKATDSTAAPSKVNKICQAILSILLTPKYNNKYSRTILTAFASQTPPNLNDALKLISGFADEEQKEKSIQYLCLLQDVNLLYKTALGLYDISLTLLIAQQSQKDPKEYLPFLQNLHVQEQLRKQFLIDDFLKNYSKALDHLFAIEEQERDNADKKAEITQEFNAYMINHGLYKQALKLYHYHSDRKNEILKHYADALYDDSKFYEAGLTYEMLEDYTSAIEADILAKNWKSALSIINFNSDKFGDKLEETCGRLVEGLSESHKYQDAAYIEYNYLHNIEEAIQLYCKDYHYDDAILLISKANRPELMSEQIESLVGEGFGTIAELVSDCKGQINSQVKRLRELRSKKREDPYAFYGLSEAAVGNEFDTPDDVSIVASETSTRESFFTRYTGKTAGTAQTGASRRTAKNRRREERKRARGKKGTIYEEEYLISSIGRLIDRLREAEPEARRLIEGLTRMKRFEQAYTVQKNFQEVIGLLKENVAEIYSMTEDDRTRVNDKGELYLIDEIPTPVIKDFENFAILDY